MSRRMLRRVAGERSSESKGEGYPFGAHGDQHQRGKGEKRPDGSPVARDIGIAAQILCCLQAPGLAF